MPVIRLSTYERRFPHPVFDASGKPVSVVRPQFLCLVKLAGSLLPQDGIIDTGAPLTCVPERLWSGLRPGTDYEWWQFPPGTPLPTGVMANWRYTFRLARFLAPIVLMDFATTIDRPEVIAAFADGNPPSAGRGMPPVVIGLWGGLLEGSTIAVGRGPAGRVVGELGFP